MIAMSTHKMLQWFLNNSTDSGMTLSQAIGNTGTSWEALTPDTGT